MPFQIDHFKEFLVQPALPNSLSRLSELAYNILWTWDHNIRSLFRRLDTTLWRACGHNPILMLGRLPQATLEKAARDPRYIALYNRACERLDAYLLQHEEPKDAQLIAYFSMEYGMAECLNIYSGGLGILSGDHLKGASDSDLPLVGVGLLYQQGYFSQTLNPDGWQQERNPVNDFYTLPVLPAKDAAGKEVYVQVKLPGGPVHIKVWQISVGRVKLYVLDTNIPENQRPEDRDITDQLYGGNASTRIRQEIVLGIGGPRALKALGIEPTVYHMNEGHSAFLAVERIRVLMQERHMTFEEAFETSRVNNVFTTHTSVPAGIDLFDTSLMYEYFSEYCREHGINFEQMLALGRWNPDDHQERFSMAITAIKASSYRNAVSALHREVSQEMWQDLWPELPLWEVPITSVTNGVHLPTWLNYDLASLYDQYLQPDWRDKYPEAQTWDLIEDIPNQELWEAHRRRKRKLVAYVRDSITAAATARKASAAEVRRLSEVLDPEILTIGFARRFATYKRATLLFRDAKRLKKILTNPDMPVQIVVAGKAHPQDHPGKGLIREIVQLSREPELQKRIVFVEDYSIQVGREMVQGVDLWLNNPRRGEEACGTSGMKAGLNGILNLSILDGWFDEAYEVSGGWAIGDREAYSEDQDEIHSSAIYSLLENEIVPMYYTDREEGVPNEWAKRMKLSLKNLSPWFNCQRMLAEYSSELYASAHRAFVEIRENDYQKVRERTKWNRKVQEAWNRIKFVEIGPDLTGPVLSGTPIPFRAVVDLAGLEPSDIRLEVVVGRVSGTGELKQTEVLELPPIEVSGAAHVFSKEYVPAYTGRLGYVVRISPNHCDDPLTRPCHSLIRWSAG
jgi:glycogen phosphorylase